MGSDSAVIGGHDILALERFMDDTRHMIIFDVLTWKSPVGDKGERLRLFLSDKGYMPKRRRLKSAETSKSANTLPSLRATSSMTEKSGSTKDERRNTMSKVADQTLLINKQHNRAKGEKEFHFSSLKTEKSAALRLQTK